jgi:hypothetical protein
MGWDPLPASLRQDGRRHKLAGSNHNSTSGTHPTEHDRCLPPLCREQTSRLLYKKSCMVWGSRETNNSAATHCTLVTSLFQNDESVTFAAILNLQTVNLTSRVPQVTTVTHPCTSVVLQPWPTLRLMASPNEPEDVLSRHR